MMKYLAPILVLLSFTDPHGVKVWIESGHIVSVIRGVDCQPPASTKLVLSNGAQCIRETIAEVVEKLR